MRIVAFIDELQLFVAKKGQTVGLAFKKHTDLHSDLISVLGCRPSEQEVWPLFGLRSTRKGGGIELSYRFGRTSRNYLDVSY